MTQKEAMTEIIKLSQNTLTADDIAGLVGCTPNQLTWIIRGYADEKAALKQRSTWDQISNIIAQVPEWVGLAKDIIKALGPIITLL